MKGLEWLKKEIWKQDIVMDKGYIYTDDLMSIINEVDEPEVLSKEWIDENKESRINNLRKRTKDDVVPVDKLQNLLVPNKDLPVIPKHVADYLEFAKKETSLAQVMETASVINKWSTMGSVFDWISPNDETFARAWLDGYKVEEEQKYYALIKGHELLADHDALSFTYWNFNMSNGYLLHGNKFSKQVRFLTKMTKEDWNKLGINDSNADFVNVEN